MHNRTRYIKGRIGFEYIRCPLNVPSVKLDTRNATIDVVIAVFPSRQFRFLYRVNREIQLFRDKEFPLKPQRHTHEPD